MGGNDLLRGLTKGPGEKASFAFLFAFLLSHSIFISLLHFHQCPWPTWGETLHVDLCISYI